MLKNCDISTVSRVSSTFSSRAPSPSPSLMMSIIYPGIKQPGGQLSGSPLNTPALNITRSKMSTNTVGHNLSNAFQPVNVPHSNSDTSFAEVAIASNENDQVCTNLDNSCGGLTDQTSDLNKTCVTQKELEKSSTDKEVTKQKRKQKSASANLKRESHAKKLDLEGSIHQRSRSNEIDYVSLGCKDTQPSVFRSPPADSMQVFTQFSLNGATAHGADDIEGDSKPIITTPSPQQKHSSFFSADIEDKESKFESREDIQAKEKRTNSESDRSSWLKEFDSSLWSNYYTTSPNHECSS